MRSIQAIHSAIVVLMHFTSIRHLMGGRFFIWPIPGKERDAPFLKRLRKNTNNIFRLSGHKVV
jgi:hypothetical protein